jgi:hypothetical protein
MTIPARPDYALPGADVVDQFWRDSFGFAGYPRFCGDHEQLADRSRFYQLFRTRSDDTGTQHDPDALEFARSGDTLIVWKLDRLARSMKQLIETVETLRVRGIGFRSLTEALDTTTAQGRLVFHMFGALAEFERSLIRERTQAGLAAARRAGRTGGRPPKLTDDDIEAAKALLANPDIGVTQIAHRLGVSPATLYRYIPAARTANTPDG